VHKTDIALSADLRFLGPHGPQKVHCLSDTEKIADLYEQLKKTPLPNLGMRTGDFLLYDALLAGCASRVAGGELVDGEGVPQPDADTIERVSALRNKGALTPDELEFVTYFDRLEEIRIALIALLEPRTHPR
jgi:hypothetical protein